MKLSELSPPITPLPVTVPMEGTSSTMLSARIPSGATRRAELKVWISVSGAPLVAGKSRDGAELGAEVEAGKMRPGNVQRAIDYQAIQRTFRCKVHIDIAALQEAPEGMITPNAGSRP